MNFDEVRRSAAIRNDNSCKENEQMNYKYTAVFYCFLGANIFAQISENSAKENKNFSSDNKTESQNTKNNSNLIELPELEVVADKPVTAASSRHVRSQDLKLRPVTKPAEILQVTPGLITAQHAGGGKASQYCGTTNAGRRRPPGDGRRVIGPSGDRARGHYTESQC